MKKIQFIFSLLIYVLLFGVIISSISLFLLSPGFINQNNETLSNFSGSLEEPLGDKNRIDPYMKKKGLTLQGKSSVKEQLPETYDEPNRDKVYMYSFDQGRFPESINSEQISDYNNYFASYEKRETSCSLKIFQSNHFVTSFIVNEPDQKQPIETVGELKHLFEVMFPQKLSYEISLGVVLDSNNRVIEIIHFANSDHKSNNFCWIDFRDSGAAKQPEYKNQLLKVIAIHNHPNPVTAKEEIPKISFSRYSEEDYKFVKNNIELYNLQKNNLSNQFILVNNLVYAESDKGLAGPTNDLTQPLTKEIVDKGYLKKN